MAFMRISTYALLQTSTSVLREQRRIRSTFRRLRIENHLKTTRTRDDQRLNTIYDRQLRPQVEWLLMKYSSNASCYITGSSHRTSGSRLIMFLNYNSCGYWRTIVFQLPLETDTVQGLIYFVTFNFFSSAFQLVVEGRHLFSFCNKVVLFKLFLCDLLL